MLAARFWSVPVASLLAAPLARLELYWMVTTLLVYELVSASRKSQSFRSNMVFLLDSYELVYPYIVKVADLAGIFTCSVYVPGRMNILCAVVDVVLKEFTAAWTVLYVPVEPTVIAPAGAVVRPAAQMIEINELNVRKNRMTKI